jgi:hypothetical protein
LGFGLRLRFQPIGLTGRRVGPTARRGDWDVGTLEEFIVDMGGKGSNNKDIHLKTAR